jgi:hypothetical protein
MGNSNTAKSTKEVLTTLKTKLLAVPWTPGPGGALLQHVEIFDMTDLALALNQLLMLKGHRVCLIVHDSEDFENQTTGNELHCYQTRHVLLVVSDRHWTKAQTALLGDGTTTPGVLTIKDLVLPAVIGLLQDGIKCEPGHGELSVVESTEKSTVPAHRIAYFQQLTLRGGEYFAELGRKPIV